VHGVEHTSDDFVEIAHTGFNAVRLPLGYWCVEGLETLGLSYEPFVGPCMQYLDQAVKWCRELGLHLVLDLHAAPGFQNKKETCGRADEGWSAWTWNADATVGVLALLASHYAQRGWAGVVRGISVLHAPSPDIDNGDLADFYCKAYSALRLGGLAGPDVAIYFPVSYRSLEQLRQHGFPHKEMQNIILDLQLYHTKGDKWLSYKARQHLQAAQDPGSHTPGLPHVLAAGCEVCVSEWNLQLPFADVR
jgi:glucan 1,3-beta-glucosidase